MKYKENILEAIGDTPLVKLGKIGKGLHFNLFAKFEAMNPGGSSKDRIAAHIVADAEARGLLKEGGTIVEATAGNTGAGLAMAAARKGYRCIFVLPDKMSLDKISLLKAYGAEIVITKTGVPPDSPESYNGVADRMAREIKGAYRVGQFTNLKNPEAHFLTTGPEIYDALDGNIDAFVAGIGTGGTISGVGKYLKQKKPDVLIVGADPEGSIISGDTPRPYKVEGIGEDFIPATFDSRIVDHIIRVSDSESFNAARRLAREEGILAGGSSGTALTAAIKFGQRLPAGANVVVFLADTGRNYLSKIFSDEWMRENGFISTPAEFARVIDVLVKKPDAAEIYSVKPEHSALQAVKMMRKYSISQVPVIDGGVSVGSLSESSVIKLLKDGVDMESTRVSDIMGAPFPTLDARLNTSELYRLLMGGYGGVLVKANEKFSGFLTKIDLINFLSDEK